MYRKWGLDMGMYCSFLMYHSYTILLETKTEWPSDEKPPETLLKILRDIAKGDIFQMTQSLFESNLVKPHLVVLSLKTMKYTFILTIKILKHVCLFTMSMG